MINNSITNNQCKYQNDDVIDIPLPTDERDDEAEVEVRELPRGEAHFTGDFRRC